MFTRVIRLSLAREEGQALVLACITLLVLSIAVLGTVKVAHDVHERIRLQNSADAAAYSMAAAEATNVKGTVMTSSPGATPAARSARCSALVPELTPMACDERQ